MYLSPWPAAFHLIDEPAESHQSHLHGLVTVVPGLLGWRADVVVPAVGQLLGGVVESLVAAAGQQVMGHGGFQEIAGHVAFVVPSVSGRPALAIAQREDGLHIAVRFLSGEDLGDPVVQRLPHLSAER